MIPPDRGRENSIRSVFFITPWAVTMTTNFPSSNSLTGRMAEMDSPCDSDSRLTIAFPFAARPASGISWTLSQKTFPVFVKNMM